MLGVMKSFAHGLMLTAILAVPDLSAHLALPLG